jgi:hypothetical protein
MLNFPQSKSDEQLLSIITSITYSCMLSDISDAFLLFMHLVLQM